MDWNPDPEDQAPFWPGSVERRGPRWVPIFVALGVVILVIVSLILWRGQDSGDTAGPDGDAPAQPTEDPAEDAVPPPEDDAVDGEEPGDDPAPVSTSTTTTTTTTVVPTTTSLPLPEAPDNLDEFGPPTLTENSTVSTVGLDTVQFGMTVAEAQVAAGTPLVPVGAIGACYHVVPYEAPEGIVFLVHQNTIERVDINDGPLTTRSGVGVGSPESIVTDLFGDSIDRQVRVDGTVDLVFVPKDPGDRNYRVVFNITDGRVRALKSGRLPQVMLDTGCEEG